MPEVRFRVVAKDALGAADLERMLELLVLAFGRWPHFDPGVPAIDHLRWKISSPATICSAVLGESGATLVTTDTPMGYRVSMCGRDALRVQFVDHAVRPQWRGHGVSSASIAFRQRTLGPLYQLSIADTQSPTMIHRAAKFGTRRFGNEVHPLVLPLARREFAKRWAKGQELPGWMALPFAALLDARHAATAHRRASAATSDPPARIVEVERFDQRIDRFFEQAREPWDFLVERSREHLDWRYCDRRGGAFRKLVAEDDDGSILGYAVACQRGDRGFVVDLMALPARTDLLTLLVSELVAELARGGSIDVVCWLQERHPYRAALRRAGFLDARERPTITFRPAGAAPGDLDFLTEPDARIHFTMGDTDLV